MASSRIADAGTPSIPCASTIVAREQGGPPMKSAARVVAVLCLAASGGSLLRAQTAARPVPSPVPSPSPSPSPNLQVLQGLSKLELQRTMNLMRASLGVHCD